MNTTVAKSPTTEDLNPFHIAALQFDRAVAYMPHLKRGLLRNPSPRDNLASGMLRSLTLTHRRQIARDRRLRG